MLVAFVLSLVCQDWSRYEGDQSPAWVDYSMPAALPLHYAPNPMESPYAFRYSAALTQAVERNDGLLVAIGTMPADVPTMTQWAIDNRTTFYYQPKTDVNFPDTGLYRFVNVQGSLVSDDRQWTENDILMGNVPAPTPYDAGPIIIKQKSKTVTRFTDAGDTFSTVPAVSSAPASASYTSGSCGVSSGFLTESARYSRSYRNSARQGGERRGLFKRVFRGGKRAGGCG